MVVKNQILGIGATMFEEVVVKISWHLSYSIKSYETFYIALYSGLYIGKPSFWAE